MSNDRWRGTRQRRINAHECYLCGKPLLNDYKLKNCEECLLKEKARKQELRRKREAEGLCVICGLTTPQKDRKSCFKCLLRKSQVLERMRERRKQMEG